MTGGTNFRSILAEARDAVRTADPAAFLVPPRIVRRVIRQDYDLPGFGFQVPHRKSYVLGRERLLEFVEPDELGLSSAAGIPARVILVSQPKDAELGEMSLAELLEHAWRLLFHSRVHIALEDRIAAGRLTAAGIRARIDRIGQVAFDEIRAVLGREDFLVGRPELAAVYVEFAAVYLEYRRFAPDRLPIWFPSLEDPGCVDEILAEDVDADALLEATRPAGLNSGDILSEWPSALYDGLPRPSQSHTTALEGRRTPDGEDATKPAVPILAGSGARPNPRRLRKLTERADLATAWGNDVRAAILHLRAARCAPAESAADAVARASAALDRLVARLRDALEFDAGAADEWREALNGLLAHAGRGFWSADRRLLWDLQKVCVDHERLVYRVDLFEWIRTLGKRPLRRALSNQREVRMSKHLRTAAGRLASVRLSGGERERLSTLLDEAARSAERQLRERIRPLIAGALDDVGLVPQNLPERVARRKLVEELLDAIVRRGFLTMGVLRDALSRSDLKLPDLSGIGELVRGDKLLRADRRLAVVLDGVYRRGEFYLRWLQRLSSVAFGTPVGRFLTLYVSIPFGGVFVILEGVRHLLELPLGKGAPAIVSIPSVIAGGCFLLGLIHVGPFRRQVWAGVRGVFRLLRAVLIDGPAWVLRQAEVRRFLRSGPVVAFRRFVFTPGVLALLFWFALPVLGLYERPSAAGGLGIYFALAAVLNTRVGRDFEEIAIDWTDSLWDRFRIRVFVALFELIMETFKRLVEGFERLLYAVDEWLRFKSGETTLTLASKAVVGIGWAAVAYLSRFCINLLVEPQINPIKHFPVVTVSHKIILPTQPVLSRALKNALEPVAAELIATGLVTVIPGVFGFLVWELKSNWRLYEANRAKRLEPVTIGDHGETLARLLKPGFHSGTVPKLYAKLRRADRQSHPGRRKRARAKLAARLHHVEDAVRRFVDREFVALLAESQAWRDVPLAVGEVAIASNSITIELRRGDRGRGGLTIAFQEQSGWLVAGVVEPGWLAGLDRAERNAFEAALGGLYERGCVQLVREQIEGCFGPGRLPYDIAEEGLVVWPGEEYQAEFRYDLKERPVISPAPAGLAASHRLPVLQPNRLIFAESPTTWQHWVETWQKEEDAASRHSAAIADRAGLLPEATTVAVETV